MSNGDLNWIANYIWGIADDVLRDLYVRGKYRDVILPMTVLRRLDVVLEDNKQAVLNIKAKLDQEGIVKGHKALHSAAKQAFYNTSKFTLCDLKARANRQQLALDFTAWLDGFSPNVQDILDSFEFRNHISKLSEADALGTLIEKLVSPDINLSPHPVTRADDSIRHPGLDNHGMGSIFEELVRRFNEENNEEAGEHWTPRDAVEIMAKLVFLPVADEIKNTTYRLFDGACGTGGMLTVAEETIKKLAKTRGKRVSIHLYGQEINAETYAICKADLLLKGEGEAADNIVGGPEHSTLSKDAFAREHFDFMLSNPPYGKSWRTENDWLEAIVALPLNLFYNTGIATYIWVLTNRKPEHRKGKVQLIDATGWFKPLRKNLGKKNCELSDDDIARICDTFLAFKESEQSKIFDNAAFGYWKVTVEQPLRLEGINPERAYKAAEIKKLKESSKRSETAPPVIRKIHRRDAEPDPLRGLFTATIKGKPAIVEYEPDTDLRDTEQIPLQEAGGIEAFLQREILPHNADAWYVESSVKIGYEISFTRHFYKPQPMRTLEEIRADILALEKETEGLLSEIVGGRTGDAVIKHRL